MRMKVTSIQPTNIFLRLWTYQAERFPLVGHGILIAAFSFSALSFSMLLRGEAVWPGGKTVLVAFVTALLFFLQLRLALPDLLLQLGHRLDQLGLLLLEARQ